MWDPGLKKRLQEEAPERSEVTDRLPPAAKPFAHDAQLIDTAAAADRLVADLSRLRVRWVALQTVACCGSLAEDAEDSTKRPLLLGLAVSIRGEAASTPVRYAFDLRLAALQPAVASLMQMPFRFLVHDVRCVVRALSAIGVVPPRQYACTWLAAKLLVLGRYHWRYQDGNSERDLDAQLKSAAAHGAETSLNGLAHRFQTVWPIVATAAEMKVRYAALGPNGPLGHMDAAYATAEAVVISGVYPHLRSDLSEQGLDYHYDHVELPAALVFAELECGGISVNEGALAKARDAAAHAVADCEQRLHSYGYRFGAPGQTTVRYEDHVRVLGGAGLLARFEDRGGYSFSEKRFQELQHLDPTIELLYRRTKQLRLLRDPLFVGELVRSTGRVHPSIDPLGADSGRPSFRRPNLVGIGRTFRPVVIPDAPGFGVAELDYCWQEPLIAAAHFGDGVLLGDCNEGDPYVRMVRVLQSTMLTPADHALDDAAIKKKHPGMRARMKILVLAILYGMGNESVATQTGLSLDEATTLRSSFFTRYARLADGVVQARRQLRDRGYTTTATGLRRYRAGGGKLSEWEARWAVNAPVQGGGACVLKLLLPRLSDLLASRGGRIVLPVFDAVVVQFPLVDQASVLEGCSSLMVETMRSLYPSTRPRVEVNDSDVSCWNKDGRSDSIARFLDDPDFKP